MHRSSAMVADRLLAAAVVWVSAPLSQAASEGSVTMVEMLLQAGAVVNAMDADGRTPLFSSVSGIDPVRPAPPCARH